MWQPNATGDRINVYKQAAEVLKAIANAQAVGERASARSFAGSGSPEGLRASAACDELVDHCQYLVGVPMAPRRNPLNLVTAPALSSGSRHREAWALRMPISPARTQVLSTGPRTNGSATRQVVESRRAFARPDQLPRTFPSSPTSHRPFAIAENAAAGHVR